MAPLPPAPQVLRIRILFGIGSKPNQGVRVFFRYSGGAPSSSDAEAIAASLLGIANTVLAPDMHPQNSVQGVAVEDLTSATGAVGEATGDTPGTRVGGPLPAESTFVTQYVIPVRYRGGHPRSGWPLGTDSDVLNPQAWQAAAVTGFTNDMLSLLEQFGTVSSGTTTVGVHVAVQYYHGFTPVQSPTTGRYRNVPDVMGSPEIRDVTAVLGKVGIGSARRRRIKGAA